MNFTARIFDRMVFLRTEFAEDGALRTEAFLWRRGVLAPAERAAAKKHLAALVVCGRGVVDRADDAQVTARVQSDAATFLWSSVGGRTAFVRREHLRPLLETLGGEGLFPAALFCLAPGYDFARAADVFAARTLAGLRWRTLLRPTSESAAAAQALVRRVGLPLLGIFLGLLAANAVLAPGLQTRRQALQAEAALRARTASDASGADARRQALLTAFRGQPGMGCAVLCDRLARAVPERLVLSSLEVEPLLRRFESGKPLQRRERTAVLSGAAPGAADISAFVRELSELACCREVRLVHVEREGERLLFRIETDL